MHPVQCKCGAIRGQIEGTGTHNRIICHCSDCRAFAGFLGKAPDVLERGGTEIIQVAQSRLHFIQGEEHLAAIRLSEEGMIRWYSSCCSTPIGNTMANSKLSFIGLIHTCLDRTRIDKDFGARIIVVNMSPAQGIPAPKWRNLLGFVARFMWIIVKCRISGEYRKSPFFTASGLPRVDPKILSTAELASLKSAV